MMTSPVGHKALTNVQFLLPELTLLAEALLDGQSWADLRQAAQEGRLFGPGTANSQLTVLTALKARLQGLPDGLLSELAHGSLETRRTLNLALVTRHRPLLRDFIAQVLLAHWQRLELQVTDADARSFLSHMAEQHPEVAAWSPATLQKTRGNLTRYLQDAGLLKETRRGEYELSPQYLPPSLRQVVEQLDPELARLLEALK
jgi:hypothetical protein